MRRPLRAYEIMPLRAGMPLPVVAEIGPRRRVVGFESLLAIRDGIAVGRSRLRVTYPSPALAMQASAQVRSAVETACAGSAVAGSDAGQAAADAPNSSVAGS